MSNDGLIPYDLTSGCQHFRPDLDIGESWTCPECGWIWFGMAPFRNVFPRNQVAGHGEPAQAASFTCLLCGMTSYNPADIRESYCGNCHDWTGAP